MYNLSIALIIQGEIRSIMVVNGLYSTQVNVLSMLQYTGMMLLEEMASIFLTPYLLIFVVPEV